MQKIFQIWLISTLVFALVASFLIGVESFIFGIFLMPLIIIASILLVLGSLTSRKTKKK